MRLRLDLLLLGCVVLTTAFALGACTTTDPQAIDYNSTIKPSESSLVRPPDVMGEADTHQAAQAGGRASLSAYQRQQLQQRQPHVEPAKNVLKPVPGMSIQRNGTAHWLVVQHKTPAQLWPLLRQFWLEQDFSLALDESKQNLMETEWKQERAAIKLGSIRQTLSKTLGSVYVTAEKNKYRTRLEIGKNGATYIFISQFGTHEISTGLTKEFTRWESTPNNPMLEIEYLQRLMYALAPKEKVSQQAALASTGALQGTRPDVLAQKKSASASAAEASSHQVTQFNLAQPFDHAWLRVGLALENENFTVDDRDREQGIYYVRYVDPHDRSTAQQGFWYQVFHGKKEKIAKQYKLNVRALSEAVTRVAVIDEAGEIDTSVPARWIVSKLAWQLR